MFVFRDNQASKCGHVLHASFLVALTSRSNDFLASLFAADGAMRVLDRDTTEILDCACGRAGVASLVRSIHENVELTDFRTLRMSWGPGELEYAWTGVLRNWGFGPARRTSGRIRIEYAGASVIRADLSIEAGVYHDLVRPRACDADDHACPGHDFALAV